MKGKTTLIVLLLAALAGFGCIGSGDISALAPIQQGWITFTLMAIFAMYMLIGIAYMVGTGFNILGLVAWCRSEIFQITATTIMVFMLAFAITGIDELSKGMTRSGGTAMEEAQDYMLCQGQFMWSTYNYLIVTSAPMQILYTSTIHIRPLRMGFSLQPAKFLQPIMDNLGIALSMLTSATWASKLVYHLLLFAEDTMLVIFLPLGVLLRAFPITRGVGGSFIAIAVAFYIALPGAVLLNSVIYEEHYGAACIPTAGTSGMFTWEPRIATLFGGAKHYVGEAMLLGSSGLGPSIFGKFGIFIGVLTFIFGGGLAALPWLLSGAVVGAMIGWMLAWAREIVFQVVILGFVGMVVDYMITFTFARELGKILGADVNLSALMKIL